MQLLLPVLLQTNHTFESFISHSQSGDVLVDVLKQSIQNDSFSAFYVSGTEETGKTHLLTACCNYAESVGKSSILLPIDQLLHSEPEVISGLEQMDVICIDNVQSLASHHEWQVAIFNLFNLVMNHSCTLVISANNIPTKLTLTLPDLVSRLQWATAFVVQELDQEEKVTALITHAHLMGFELGQEAATFMINRLPRNMSILMSSLKVLAKSSIEQQRKVTVPFVKECLNI